MSTIRQRLTVRLLAGLVVLLVVGGGIGYWLAAAALTRQFDETLRAKVTSMAMLIEEEDGGRLEMDTTDVFLHEFEPYAGAPCFQLWDASRNVVLRSKSLQLSDLPFGLVMLAQPSFQNLVLPSGVAGRCATIKFTPRPTDDGKPPAIIEDAILAVAIERQGLNQTLTVLRLVLAACGALIVILTATLLPFLLRRELAPVNCLADQAEQITATSLSSRFPVEELPNELKPISLRLNDLLQRLQTAFDCERQFSNDVAHEFRTPLAELRSLAELSLKWPDTHSAETDKQTLDIVIQMQNVIDRLLDIARSEQGRTSARRESVDLTILCGAIRQSLQKRLAARGLTVQMAMPSSVEIVTDRVLLRSILSNLIENAVEYAPVGSTVHIDASTQTERFDLRISNPAEDLGPADIAHLFVRFWRKDSARSKSDHAGLGLSLARAAAESLGYTLKASLDGRGWLIMALSGPPGPEQPGPKTGGERKSGEVAPDLVVPSRKPRDS